MPVTEDGKVTETSPVQPLKANSPMPVTVDGKTISVRLVHPEKEFDPIPLTSILSIAEGMETEPEISDLSTTERIPLELTLNYFNPQTSHVPSEPRTCSAFADTTSCPHVAECQ